MKERIHGSVANLSTVGYRFLTWYIPGDERFTYHNYETTAESGQLKLRHMKWPGNARVHTFRIDIERNPLQALLAHKAFEILDVDPLPAPPMRILMLGWSTHAYWTHIPTVRRTMHIEPRKMALSWLRKEAHQVFKKLAYHLEVSRKG